MRKAVLPTCLIMLVASIICFLVAKEYYTKRRNETLKKLEKKTEMAVSEEADDKEALSVERLTVSDTVLLIKKDIDGCELTLRNIEGGNDKVLEYDRTTTFISKGGNPFTPDELVVGEVLDVTFTTYNSRLSEVKQSKSAWINKSINKFAINEKAKTIKVGSDLFELDKNVLVASGDRIQEVMDITELDTITLYGMDKKIYSIVVEGGHGYIRVLNDSYFVGGWIEIGQDIIKVLTEDMLIPVPEGKYDIKVTNKGYLGRETLKVERDKETRLDLSKIEIEEVAIGHVQFNVTPDFAQLYVDGLMTDFEERVPLEYGIHSIRAQMAGYETVSFNIKVGSEFSNVDIELDRDDDADDSDSSSSDSGSDVKPETNNSNVNSSSSDSSSSNDSSTVVSVLSDNKKIFVEGPVGAEVYLDGSYFGVAPCSTNKVTGSHTITLSKDGYQTKSYSINVSNDGNDLTMSFSDLVPN